MVSGRRKFDHISDVLRDLEWLTARNLHVFHALTLLKRMLLKGLTQLWKSRRIFPKYMPKCSVSSTNNFCPKILSNVEDFETPFYLCVSHIYHVTRVATLFVRILGECTCVRENVCLCMSDQLTPRFVFVLFFFNSWLWLWNSHTGHWCEKSLWREINKVSLPSANNTWFGLHPRGTVTSHRAIFFTIAHWAATPFIIRILIRMLFLNTFEIIFDHENSECSIKACAFRKHGRRKLWQAVSIAPLSISIKVVRKNFSNKFCAGC